MQERPPITMPSALSGCGRGVLSIGNQERRGVRTIDHLARRRGAFAHRPSALAAIAIAGCGSSAHHKSAAASTSHSTTATTPATTTSSSTVSASQCGPKPGVKATGSPIALGAIVTNQPGTSFTDIANMAKAYFTCVNDNGGVNGHPIKYYIETEQTNPAQIAGEAKQLVQSDHV